MRDFFRKYVPVRRVQPNHPTVGSTRHTAKILISQRENEIVGMFLHVSLSFVISFPRFSTTFSGVLQNVGDN